MPEVRLTWKRSDWLLALVLGVAGCASPGRPTVIADPGSKRPQLEADLSAAGGTFVGSTADDAGLGYFLFLRSSNEGYAILWKADPKHTLQPEMATALSIEGKRIEPPDQHTAVYALRPDLKLEELSLSEAARRNLFHLLSERAGRRERSAALARYRVTEFEVLSVVSADKDAKLLPHNYCWRVGDPTVPPRIAKERDQVAQAVDDAMTAADGQFSEKGERAFQTQEAIKALRARMDSTGESLAFVTGDQGIAYFVRMFPDRPGYAILWKCDSGSPLQPKPAETLIVDGLSIVPSSPGIYALRPDLRLERMPLDERRAGELLATLCQRARETDRPDWSNEPSWQKCEGQLSTVIDLSSRSANVMVHVPGSDKSLHVSNWNAGPAFPRTVLRISSAPRRE